MANASKDENGVSTLLAISNSNGVTIVPVKGNPTTHCITLDIGTTGSDLGPMVAQHDGNSIPTSLAVSSADGVTPVALYATSSGALLITIS